MKNAITIANAYLKLSRPEVGDNITNLKLQKLLYYTQGFYLAIYGVPIFEEKLIAWEHGPVVKEVYDKFKEFGSSAIDIPDTKVILTKKEINLITNIWKIYGQFSAWKLREMTHREYPWKNTKRNGVIKHEDLRLFFKDLVVNGN